MSLRNNEQRVLDAIENQLQAEEPQLANRFSQLGGKSPRIKSVPGWDQAAPVAETAPRRETAPREEPAPRREPAPHEETAPREGHQDTDGQAGAIGTHLVLLILGALILVGFAVGVASWMRTR